MEELARATAIIGYDEVIMLGYRGLGHAGLGGQRPARAPSPRPRWTRRSSGWWPSSGGPGPRSWSSTATSSRATPTPTTSGSTRWAWPPSGRPATRLGSRTPGRRGSRPSCTTRGSRWPGSRRSTPSSRNWASSRPSTRRGVRGGRIRPSSPSPPRSTSPSSPTCAGEALLAHATQVDPNSPFWFGLPPEVMRTHPPLRRLPAGPGGRPRRDGGGSGRANRWSVETDLFEGVREGPVPGDRLWAFGCRIGGTGPGPAGHR